MKKSKVSGYYDDEYLRTVRIGLLNIEGTDSLVVKQHDEGFSQPYYFSVPDFKKGYVEVVVDRDFTSTIQIRSYNKNGWTDSEEYVIAPVEPTGINVSFDIDNDKIHVNPTSRKYGDATSLISEYTIASVNKSGQQNTIQAAFTRETNDVDVSGLESGIYMLTVSDILGEKHAIKFVR